MAALDGKETCGVADCVERQVAILGAAFGSIVGLQVEHPVDPNPTDPGPAAPAAAILSPVSAPSQSDRAERAARLFSRALPETVLAALDVLEALHRDYARDDGSGKWECPLCHEPLDGSHDDCPFGRLGAILDALGATVEAAAEELCGILAHHLGAEHVAQAEEIRETALSLGPEAGLRFLHELAQEFEIRRAVEPPALAEALRGYRERVLVAAREAAAREAALRSEAPA
jgi:hypothetical protein